MLNRYPPAAIAARVSPLAAALIVTGCAGLIGLQDRTADMSDAGDAAAVSSDTGASSNDATAMSDVTAPGQDASTNDVTTPTPDAPSTADVAMPPCPDPCQMAAGLNEAFVMTSNAYDVFWVDYGDAPGAGNGQLKSCGVGGCNDTPAVWRTNLMDPRGIAVDATNVYWATTWGGIVGTLGAIWSCNAALGPAGCQNPTKLAAALDPYGLAVDSTYVYWVDANSNSVHRVKTNGTGTDEILYTPPGGDGGLGVFLDSPARCAVDSTNLYILDVDSTLYRLPKTGGTPTVVVMGNGIVSDLTVDGTGYVYFGMQGGIQRKSGSAATATLVSSPSTAINQPDGLALDSLAGMLYWADYGSGVANDGAIGRVTTSGAQAILLQSSLETPSSVTVSGDYVYWLSAGQLLSSTSTNTSYVATNTGSLWRTHK